MEARAFYYFRGRYTFRQNSKIVERGSLSRGNQNGLRKTGFVFGTEQDVCTMIRAFFSCRSRGIPTYEMSSPSYAKCFGGQADKQKSRDEIRMRFVPG